jgi:hypothetical protein
MERDRDQKNMSNPDESDEERDRNMRETQKIGTGISGSRNAYTGGKPEENEFITDRDHKR